MQQCGGSDCKGPNLRLGQGHHQARSHEDPLGHISEDHPLVEIMGAMESISVGEWPISLHFYKRCL